MILSLRYWLLMLSFLAVIQQGMGQRTLHKAYTEATGVSTGTFGDIASLENGNPVILVERFTNFSKKGFQLIVLDDNLEIVDSVSVVSDFTLNNLSLICKNDTLYIAGNIDNEASSNIFFASFTKNLVQIRVKILESNLNYAIYKFMIHPQGGFAAVGYIIGQTTGPGGAIGNIGNMSMRFNEKGEVTWCRRLNYASTGYGSGNVLPNGDIISSGGSKFWNIDASGSLKWAVQVDNFDLINSHQSIGSSQYFIPTNYQLDLKQVMRLNVDGSFIGVTQGVKINPPHFSGVIGQNLVIGSSYLTTDSVFLQLNFIGSDGKVIKQTLLDNFFGFAPTGSLQDPCKYKMHVTKNGTPLILAVAYRQGFGVYKLDKDGNLGCLSMGGEFSAGPQAEPGFVINSFSLTEHQTGFADFTFSTEAQSRFNQIVVCDNCIPLKYKLPNDTALCEGQKLNIQIPSDVLKVEWNDGSSSKTKVFSDSGLYICTLYSTCDTLIDSLRIRKIKVDPIKLQYDSESLIPKEPIDFSANPQSFIKTEWYLSDSLYSTGLQWNHSFSENGKYTVRVRGYNEHCWKEDSVLLDVFLIDWYLPNAFTPNNDDRNEVWGPVGSGLKNYELLIYSRWGELVYQGLNGFWDGKFKGQLVIDGLYLYYLNGLDDEGEKVAKKGLITLIH